MQKNKKKKKLTGLKEKKTYKKKKTKEKKSKLIGQPVKPEICVMKVR
jgi:hypothetical protein